MIDLGLQPLERCPSRRKRYWTAGERLKCCPKCQGPLEDRLERRQEFHTGCGSKRKAEEELAKALTSITYATYTQLSKILMGEFLTNEWLPAIESTVRPTTFLSCQGHVERHLVPALGRIPLQQVTGGQINAFYTNLLSQNGDGKKRTISPSTVRRNPCDLAQSKLPDSKRQLHCAAHDRQMAILCGEDESPKPPRD